MYIYIYYTYTYTYTYAYYTYNHIHILNSYKGDEGRTHTSQKFTYPPSLEKITSTAPNFYSLILSPPKVNFSSY